MIRRYIRTLLLALLFPFLAISQSPDTSNGSINQKVEIYVGTGLTLINNRYGFFETPLTLMWRMISISTEFKVSNRISLNAEIALPLEIDKQDADPTSNNLPQIVSDLDPAVFTVDVRYCYLLKPTPYNNFSGYYFSLHNRGWLSEKYNEQKGIYNGLYCYTGIHTGLKRTFLDSLFFDANLGYGLNYGNNISFLSPLLNFGIGFRIY